MLVVRCVRNSNHDGRDGGGREKPNAWQQVGEENSFENEHAMRIMLRAKMSCAAVG